MTQSGADMSKLLQKFKSANTGEKEKKIENEDERRPTATSSQVKKNDDNWDEDDYEQEYTRKTEGKTAGAKKKTTSKNNQPAAWGEAPQTDILADEFKEKEAPKKGIMSKPGTKHVQKAEIVQEEFPDLGAEIDPSTIKKKAKSEPTQSAPATTTTTTTGGPRRFVNTKKPAGETFAHLEPTPEKKVEEHEEKPQATTTTTTTATTETKTEAPKHGFIQRGPARSELASKAETTQAEVKKEEPVADSKFKFGGEGPKRFIGGAKKEGHREEQKTEADLKREEAERRAEEALQAERARLVAEQENKKKKFGQKGEKPEGEKKHENGKTHEHNGPKKEHDGKPSEKKEKKNKTDEFFSKEKGGDKPKKDAQPTKEKEKEAPKEEQTKAPVTQIIKTDHAHELSHTGWDMPIKKTTKNT